MSPAPASVTLPPSCIDPPPLDGVDGVCELRKMYFKPGLRGLGAGTALIARCLHAARRLGYRQC
ncbi:MAG: GNAT family N-acetyltransferase [Pseudomonadota bacterium]